MLADYSSAPNDLAPPIDWDISYYKQSIRNQELGVREVGKKEGDIILGWEEELLFNWDGNFFPPNNFWLALNT